MFEISTGSAVHIQMDQNRGTCALVERIVGLTIERRQKKVKLEKSCWWAELVAGHPTSKGD